MSYPHRPQWPGVTRVQPRTMGHMHHRTVAGNASTAATIHNGAHTSDTRTTTGFVGVATYIV